MSKVSNHPGRLNGQVILTLHTADAQKLVLGLHHKKSINLLQFAARIGEIWSAAALDDPYADLYLLKIYDLITKCRHQLAAVIKDCQERLNQVSNSHNFKVNPFASEKPVNKSLWFKTPYGYLAASIIADFDNLMRILLTTQRVGLLSDTSDELVRQQWIDQVLTLFQLPFTWQNCSITRVDFQEENESAKVALRKMGDLPEAILTKKLRSPLAPKIFLDS